MQFLLFQIGQVADSLGHRLDSLSTVVKHNEVAHVWAVWLPPLVTAILAAGLTGYIQDRIRRKNTKVQQERIDASYAAVWGAVMIEISKALGRMKYQATEWLNDNAPNALEIELVDGLHLSYLSVSQHPMIAGKILSIYDNIIHYRNSYHDGLEAVKDRLNPHDHAITDLRMKSRIEMLSEMRVEILAGPAVAIARDYHALMVQDFNTCLSEFRRFLTKTHQDFDYEFSQLELLDEKWRRTEGVDDVGEPAK
jgi:hypothetical protein